jgi:nitroimidazol reductase NimA-like FMN-containing flavoprotein (pyridoxamine 5'-phosphate oxidase superfamily)
MRREDRGITDPAAMGAATREAKVCRIGLADNGESCVVPVSFG